jgi:hypothetical protein
MEAFIDTWKDGVPARGIRLSKKKSHDQKPMIYAVAGGCCRSPA